MSKIKIIRSRSHSNKDFHTWGEKHFSQYELISIGSSLKFCFLAEGIADIYPRLGPTSEWDTAAAHAIVEGAGGEVLKINGEPLM